MRSYVAAEAQRTMIVYGDPQFTTTPAAMLAQWREHLTSVPSLDELRSALILAGQLEQALADAFSCSPIVAAAQELTDALGSAFHHVFSDGATDHQFPCWEKISAALKDESHTRVVVKVPEGFAFYSLFPEQYIVAAQRWADERDTATTKSVLVVGLRSIGTTLSAVVATALRARGWLAQRVTVRPTGNPFDRRCELPRVAAEFAIVTDEGPGLSGSSMAAAAEALAHTGFTRDRIAFLPAHGNEPGHAASERVRKWWHDVPRYPADLTAVRWRGKSLQQLLMKESAALHGAEPVAIEDASGGLWRRFAFANEDDWPAANIAFERAKFLVKFNDGHRVLWKFSGLLPSVAPAPTTELTITPLGQCHGFSAWPWIPGERLRRHDMDAALMTRISEHITRASGESLREDRGSAYERLAEMLVCNSTEALGPEAQRRSERLARDAEKPARETVYRSYGDGRLAPHGFVRDAAGRIFKGDCGGHDRDHTVVGTQPVLWDFAGLAVEWRLSTSRREAMLRHAGLAASPALMKFYRAAYAAFRLGMFTLVPGEAAELSRSRRAQRFYLEALRRALAHEVAGRKAVTCG